MTPLDVDGGAEEKGVLLQSGVPAILGLQFFNVDVVKFGLAAAG